MLTCISQQSDLPTQPPETTRNSPRGPEAGGLFVIHGPAKHRKISSNFKLLIRFCALFFVPPNTFPNGNLGVAPWTEKKESLPKCPSPIFPITHPTHPVVGGGSVLCSPVRSCGAGSCIDCRQEGVLGEVGIPLCGFDLTMTQH